MMTLKGMASDYTDIYIAGIDVIRMLHFRSGLQNNSIVVI